MKLIPDDAIATLVAVDRVTSDHQVPGTMAVYSYEPASEDPDLWHLTELEREGEGSLRVDTDGQKISIYGDSADNIHNANNIASMLGWKTCQLFARDSTSEQACLRQLVNVQVLNAPPGIAEAPAPASANPVGSHIPAPPASSHLIDVPPELDAGLPGDSFEDATSVSPQTGALVEVTRAIEERAQAQMHAAGLEEKLSESAARISQLEQHCRSLESEVERLQREAASSNAGTGAAPSSALLSTLLRFAEDHLADRLQTATGDADPLIRALRSNGLGVRVSIVSKAT